MEAVATAIKTMIADDAQREAAAADAGGSGDGDGAAAEAPPTRNSKVATTTTTATIGDDNPSLSFGVSLARPPRGASARVFEGRRRRHTATAALTCTASPLLPPPRRRQCRLRCPLPFLRRRPRRRNGPNLQTSERPNGRPN